jgi:hypothetical protein
MRIHQYFEDYTYISNIGYNIDLKMMYNYLCIINSLIWTSEVTLWKNDGGIFVKIFHYGQNSCLIDVTGNIYIYLLIMYNPFCPVPVMCVYSLNSSLKMRLIASTMWQTPVSVMIPFSQTDLYQFLQDSCNFKIKNKFIQMKYKMHSIT